MDRVLVFDVETTGLIATADHVVEVGCVLWSVEHRTIVEAHSVLLGAPENPAAPFNGLSDRLLLCEGRAQPYDRELGWAMICDAARRADAVLAHFAHFDHSFVMAWPQPGDVADLLALPWVCTAEDVVWPLQPHSRSLVSLALAHGVAVTAAHRAINDCLLLTNCLERLPDLRERLDAALASAMRPKAHFVAVVPFEQNDEVKAAGFRWRDSAWRRYMAVEDAAALAFRVVYAEVHEQQKLQGRPAGEVPLGAAP